MTERNSQFARSDSQRGVALITALLLLILMSALAVALLYKVNYEVRLQTTDSGNNVAFYGTEAGMEKMMADLTAIYKLQAAPSCVDLKASTLTPPTTADMGLTYPTYTIALSDGTTLDNCVVPPTRTQSISQGSNAGLQAQTVDLQMQVAALRPSGESVSMIRQVEVARIPIFQFGVFSDSDLSFFPGPDFDFNGRVHTNGNLFLSEGSGAHLWFHKPIRAAGDVVRDQLANGQDTKTQGRTGTVLIPNTSSGCDSKPTTQNSSCLDLAYGEGSSIGGPTPTNGGTGAFNVTWPTTSTGPTPTNYNSMILAGVKRLQMAFVKNGVDPIEIIRKPQAAEDPNSTLYESRLYSEAQIRVLITDDPAELPGGAGDTVNNVRLANVAPYAGGVNVTGVGATYFAQGNSGVIVHDATANADLKDTSWTTPTISVDDTLVNPNQRLIAPTQWNLLDGYLRVEYLDKNTLTYVPVTQEWLQLGFARDFTPPTGGVNSVHPNAILILQELADRNGDGNKNASQPGTPSTTYQPSATTWSSCLAADPYSCPAGATPTETKQKSSCSGTKYQWRLACTSTPAGTPAELVTNAGNYVTGATAVNNWYPINMYDTREGEFRDANDGICRVNGVLNLVEIDVDHLRKWLKGTIAGSGQNVEFKTQNGYILYFSDRRGMRPNPTANPVNTKNGEYGFEDVLNASNNNGAPDGRLDSGEDVDRNKAADQWGSKNLGLGFGLGALLAGKPATTQQSVACPTTARANWVSGARHGVRLVDAAAGSLPTRLDIDSLGGFTLASENPAYILGNYNATNAGFVDPHASSAVIADTVTLLSNGWSDINMFANPTNPTNRNAADTWYRVAIATGKNMSFAVQPYLGQPGVTAGNPDFGTDGGVHNFLRYLEDWGGRNIYYKGSMASMYYSQYATGVFKCCTTVYSPPSRNYAFDLDFDDLSKMPPGTPTVTDVVNLGFQQLF